METIIETFNQLSELDQKVVISYLVSGAIFVWVAYFIYSLKKVAKLIRFPISTLSLFVGFMLLSACGKIAKNYHESYTYITLWVVFGATVIAIWTGAALYKFNQKLINKK